MCTLDGKTKGKGREKFDFRTGKSEKTQITWISQNTMPSTEHNGDNGFMQPVLIHWDLNLSLVQLLLYPPPI